MTIDQQLIATMLNLTKKTAVRAVVPSQMRQRFRAAKIIDGHKLEAVVIAFAATRLEIGAQHVTSYPAVSVDGDTQRNADLRPVR